jgi:hypothetical protein
MIRSIKAAIRLLENEERFFKGVPAGVEKALRILKKVALKEVNEQKA